MSNPFEITFTLRQHTPIIHFQHGQEGATLRATEVKPKLDRFIIEKLTGMKGEVAFDFFKENIRWGKWLVGKGEHPALDYKLSIVQNGKDVRSEIENKFDYKGKTRSEKFPTFFALLGTADKVDNPDKVFKFCEHHKLTIRTFIEPLKEAIEKNIHEFFLVTNFGTRQSKGFGSYTIYEAEFASGFRYKYRFVIDTNKINVRYNGENSCEEHYKWYKLFYAINLFYNTLKSGLNQYDKGNDSFYFKSLLFLYTKHKLNAQWDKKAIKEKFLSTSLTRQQNHYKFPDILSFTGNQQYLMRDLLGLASDSAWKAEYNENISKSHPEIDRFKSPIFFKPLEREQGFFEVYISLNQEAVSLFTGKTFTVSNSQGKKFNISTPTNFDLDDFFEFAIGTDIKKHVQFKYGSISSPDLKLLEKIYSDLKTSMRL